MEGRFSRGLGKRVLVFTIEKQSIYLIYCVCLRIKDFGDGWTVSLSWVREDYVLVCYD